MQKWYLGSQNDGLFILDAPPRPSTDDMDHSRTDGPTIAIPVWQLPPEVAQIIVDAHNSTTQKAVDTGWQLAVDGQPGDPVRPPSVPVLFHSLDTTIDGRAGTTIIATDEKTQRFVGQIQLYGQPYQIGCLRGLFVLEDYRKKGVGTGLVKAACQTLKMRNRQVANLTVQTDNHAAARLYHSLGFEIVGMFPEDHEIIMALRLAPSRSTPPPALLK